MKHNILLDMPHVLIHGPPMSGKQSTVRSYLTSNGFPISPKYDYKLSSNNYIHAHHISNNFGTLFEFHWKDVFCNESLLFFHIFELLQNSFILRQSPSILVCYNIDLCSNQKTYQILYKCMDKFPNIKVILTTLSICPLSLNLINRCQCIRFSSSVSTSSSPKITSFDSNNLRSEIHKLLINIFDYNKCIYLLLHYFLDDSRFSYDTSSISLICKKAIECSHLCKNNEFYVQYILEHFVFFILSKVTP